VSENISDLPDEVDWIKKHAVTPIKNQLQCGSSPYFGAVVSLEGAWKIAGNPLLVLSEQQITDCSGNFGNQGCNGGMMLWSLQYVKQFGIELNASYPYTGTSDTCTYDSSKVVFRTKDPVDISSNTEENLQEALVKVPVATAVDASSQIWQLYTGGIISAAECGVNVDHGIGVVGYGSTSDGKQYYVLKNTWTETWGLKGYVWIERNSKTTPACGVTLDASYAVI